MKKNRLIFYIVFAIYNISAFIFTIALPSIMFDMVKYVPYFKYLTLFGLLLFIADVAWSLKTAKDSEKEKTDREHELTTLKAKLFDLQEASKK